MICLIYSGDKYLDRQSKKNTFKNEKTIKYEVSYPERGRHGSEITCIEVQTDVSSKHVDISVVSGGIGQHYAVISIKGYSTKWLDYVVYTYGFK